MSALSRETAEKVVGSIIEYGNILTVSRKLGLSVASISRYLREAKTLNMLDNDVHLVGTQFYAGDVPLGWKTAEDPIDEMVRQEKARRGYRELESPVLVKLPGPHVTLDIGDLHATDEDFLWDSFFSTLKAAAAMIGEVDPGWVTVRGLGDWISGKGIFRGQEVRNITNHAHWQTLLGGYFCVLIEAELKKHLRKGVDIEFEYIKGNHDQADGGSVNLAYYLCNEAYASFGIPMRYAGTETVANYGTEEDPVWALVVHGFGASDYSPHSNTLLRKLSKRIADLNVERTNGLLEPITELRTGHTHWLQARGLRYTRNLTVYCTGGFQRNKRPELGQNQRPTGFILTVADATAYQTIEVCPDDDVFVDEINSPDLEFRNLQRTGATLREALDYMISLREGTKRRVS